MEENRLPDAVPYIAYEDAMVRNERLVRRLVLTIALCIILLFVSNAIWIYKWNQYDTISYDQDGSGLNNICTGTQGDVLNGTKVKDKETEKQKESKGREGSEEQE